MSTYLWDLEHKSFDFLEVEHLIKAYADKDVAEKAYEMFEFLYKNKKSFFLESNIKVKGFASGFIVLSAACLAYEVDNRDLSNVYSVCRNKSCSNAREFYDKLVKCDGWTDVFKEGKIPLLCDEIIQR